MGHTVPVQEPSYHGAVNLVGLPGDWDDLWVDLGGKGLGSETHTGTIIKRYRYEPRVARKAAISARRR